MAGFQVIPEARGAKILEASGLVQLDELSESRLFDGLKFAAVHKGPFLKHPKQGQKTTLARQCRRNRAERLRGTNVVQCFDQPCAGFGDQFGIRSQPPAIYGIAARREPPMMPLASAAACLRRCSKWLKRAEAVRAGSVRFWRASP